jgi:hypothetical protein
MIQVSGTVIDVTTDHGLPGATIAVDNAPVGATDSDGNFTVNLDSYDHNITASSVGYATRTQTAGMVQESGLIQLAIAPEDLQEAVVTAHKKDNSFWLILAGIALVASTSQKKTTHAVGAKGSSLVPLAVVGLGVGAYLMLKPKAATLPAGSTYHPPVSTPASGGGSILSTVSSLADIFKNIFGGSSGPSYAPVGIQQQPGYSSDPNAYSPAAGYPTLPTTAPVLTINPGAYSAGSDYNYAEDSFAGMGDTGSVTFNAGDIIDHTLIAATSVPVYDEANDSAQPVGYIAAGNPIGVVFSFLVPNPAAGRVELWWMFQAPNDNYQFGNEQGFYFVPHKAGYFDTKSLQDSGVLTTAQATALAQGKTPSALTAALDKYLPWVIAGLVAVGIGKAVINKAL